MLHGEGGETNFCFGAVVNADGCGKVIRSSREAGKECSSHLKCRCVTSPHLPLLQSAFPPVHQQPGYLPWDTLTSLCFWSAANPGGGIFYLATCTEASTISRYLGTSELFPFFLCLLCFLFPFTLTQTHDVVYHLIPFSALSEELSTVVYSSSLHSLLLR